MKTSLMDFLMGVDFSAPLLRGLERVYIKKRSENSLKPSSKDCLSILEWLTLPCYRWEAPLGSLFLGVSKRGCKCLNSACYELMVLVGLLRATPTHFRWFVYPTAISTDRFTLLTFWNLDFWGCLRPPRQNYSRWQLMPKCMLLRC